MLMIGLSYAGKPEGRSERRTDMKPMKEIYLAGGCFWGIEHFLKQIEGVEATQVGYANGNIANPTYQQVCTGTTDFAETVKVQYDSDKVTLPFLIDLYFKTIDPTSLNRQGNDRGTQYRTGIYYTDAADLPVIRETVSRLAANYTRPLEVEIEPLKNFYPAEENHQDYLDKNPGGYCHINPVSPMMQLFVRNSLQNSMPLPRKMPPNRLSVMPTGMNTVRASMWILLRVSLCSSLPISSIPVADGPVSPSRLTAS